MLACCVLEQPLLTRARMHMHGCSRNAHTHMNNIQEHAELLHAICLHIYRLTSTYLEYLPTSATNISSRRTRPRRSNPDLPSCYAQLAVHRCPEFFQDPLCARAQLPHTLCLLDIFGIFHFVFGVWYLTFGATVLRGGFVV